MPSAEDITEGRNMFDTLFDARPILNSSNEFNFTIGGYNTSFGDFENGNASRHFADELPTHDVVYTFPMFVILILSFVPCGLIVIGSLLWFTRLRQRLPQSSRSLRRSVTTEERSAAFQRSRRPDLLTLVHEGANRNHQMLFPNCDEVPLDTPSSIYPDDKLPSYTDSTRNLYSETITTPLSNSSIITMTMRNNYLIVETEERVPVNCSVLMRDLPHQSTLPNCSSFATAEAVDHHSADVLDNGHRYSDEHLPNICLLLGDEERRSFYKSMTSGQLNEEDQHVELFHKNILPVTTSSYCEQETVHTIPSCSYNYDDDDDDDEERCWTGDDGPAVKRVAANTGFTQSDLTGSPCSTSRHPRTDYGYSNQSEYVTSEFPRRKRASSLKLPSEQKKEIVAKAFAAAVRTGDLWSAADSVLQHCSSPEFSEPSK